MAGLGSRVGAAGRSTNGAKIDVLSARSAETCTVERGAQTGELERSKNCPGTWARGAMPRVIHWTDSAPPRARAPSCKLNRRRMAVLDLAAWKLCQRRGELQSFSILRYGAMAAILKSTAAKIPENVVATAAQGIVTRCGDWRGGKSVKVREVQALVVNLSCTGIPNKTMGESPSNDLGPF